MAFENLIMSPNKGYQELGFSFGGVQQPPQQTVQQFDPPQQPIPPQPMMYCNPGLMGAMHSVASAYNQTSFGDLVTIVNKEETSGVGINIGNLVTSPDPRANVAVGLSFNGLAVKEDPKPSNYEVPTQNPMFDSLVNQPMCVPQKFALQPIPIDLDRSMLPKPTLVSNAIDEVNAHLIKSNAQNQSSNKKINNWFTRMIEQKGEDYFFSGRVSVDDIGRNAEKILDDMISGRVDYNKQGQYIIQPIIIETLINYCSNKLAINKAIQYSLGYVYNDYTNRMMFTNDQERMSSLSVIDDSLSRNITQAIAIVNQDIGVYELLYNKLMFVNATKNASSLFSLTNDLNNYKKQAKKRY